MPIGLSSDNLMPIAIGISNNQGFCYGTHRNCAVCVPAPFLAVNALLF